MATKKMKRRNPYARVVRKIKMKVVRPKKGRGSYKRKTRMPTEFVVDPPPPNLL